MNFLTSKSNTSEKLINGLTFSEEIMLKSKKVKK